MKPLRRTAVALIACIAGVTLAGQVHAHGARARAHIGFHIGVPLVWPYWTYPYPYYYPPYRPNVVVVPAEPTTYVERPSASGDAGTGFWYYCAGAGAYYPYVQECPGGWQRVPPRPAGE
jgi:hypothetical protein